MFNINFSEYSNFLKYIRFKVNNIYPKKHIKLGNFILNSRLKNMNLI